MSQFPAGSTVRSNETLPPQDHPGKEQILINLLTLAKPEPVPRRIDDERTHAYPDKPEENRCLQGKVRQKGAGYRVKSE